MHCETTAGAGCRLEEFSLTRALEFMMGFGIMTGAAFAAILVWWLVYDEPSPISYHGNHKIIQPVVKAGQLVNIGREFTITKKTLLHINRYVYTVTKDGVTYTYDLPLAVSNKDPGVYRQQRLVQIPAGLIPGQYTLKTKVCWQPNLIKTQCVDVPDVKFTVVP